MRIVRVLRAVKSVRALTHFMANRRGDCRQAVDCACERVPVARTGRYAEAERILRSGLARAQIDGNMFIEAGIHLTSAALSLERKDYAAVQREVAASRDPLSAVPTGYARHWSFIAETLAGLRILAWGVRAGLRRLLIRRLTHSGRRTRSSASGIGSCRESWRSCAEMLLVQPGHSPPPRYRGAVFHWTSRVRW